MTTSNENIRFHGSPELQRKFEEGAARMNLTPGAYLQFLLARRSVSVGTKRFDRMARAVFERYGRVMRKLAQ